ncbi:hypothetical protein B0I27_1122 [Arcticibacter pallidicorallinus]|uniref:Uncharacterized protein n=1 Tax=Arcticibacter pallidicorallinus TaxID=1259464 RepID=A0A2T0TUC2_9SPHI|nr:hypothetical protein B0I27_1122 [Arcticibacter pallidicorallinus]
MQDSFQTKKPPANAEGSKYIYNIISQPKGKSSLPWNHPEKFR